MTELFAWVFLCGGLFGLAAAHFRWYESEFWQSMDWFDTHSALDKEWVAGGKRRYYYTTGLLLALVGLMLLCLHYLR